MVFINIGNFYLSKLICNPKPSSRILPGDVVIGAKHPAGSAFYTALDSDLNSSPILRAISAYWAEGNTRLIFTCLANCRINDC